jgi:ribonuclease P protein component
VLYAARTQEVPTVRLGTTVPRRLGNAVVRNKLKRRIRECFRLRLRYKFTPGISLVVIGRNGAQGLTAAAIADELGNAAEGLRARLECP